MNSYQGIALEIGSRIFQRTPTCRNMTAHGRCPRCTAEGLTRGDNDCCQWCEVFTAGSLAVGGVIIHDSRPVAELHGVGQIQQIVSYGDNIPVEVSGHISVGVVKIIESIMIIVPIFFHVVSPLFSHHIGNLYYPIPFIKPVHLVYHSAPSPIAIQIYHITMLVIFILDMITAAGKITACHRIGRSQPVVGIISEAIAVHNRVGIGAICPIHRRYISVITNFPIVSHKAFVIQILYKIDIFYPSDPTLQIIPIFSMRQSSVDTFAGYPSQLVVFISPIGRQRVVNRIIGAGEASRAVISIFYGLRYR